jgi:hypothetical protein
MYMITLPVSIIGVLFAVYSFFSMPVKADDRWRMSRWTTSRIYSAFFIFAQSTFTADAAVKIADASSSNALRAFVYTSIFPVTMIFTGYYCLQMVQTSGTMHDGSRLGRRMRRATRLLLHFCFPLSILAMASFILCGAAIDYTWGWKAYLAFNTLFYIFNGAACAICALGYYMYGLQLCNYLSEQLDDTEDVHSVGGQLDATIAFDTARASIKRVSPCLACIHPHPLTLPRDGR